MCGSRHWRLSAPGALLQLPPRSLKELDLSNNGMADVGAALSRFEHLVALRLGGNQLTSLELHYLPRLRELVLSHNQLKILPEMLGLPALQVTLSS